MKDSPAPIKVRYEIPGQSPRILRKVPGFRCIDVPQWGPGGWWMHRFELVVPETGERPEVYETRYRGCYPPEGLFDEASA